jgi:hypothetical protein
MIRKSMPSGHDPMGGHRFSEKIMLKQKIERDDDSKKSHPARGGGIGDATLAFHINGHLAGRLQRLSGASFHHGQHGHGPSIDARDDRHIPAQWPESVLGDDPARNCRHDAGADTAGV